MIEINQHEYDILVDTEVIVDVMFGHTFISLRDFLNLGEGDVVSLNKQAGEGGDVYVNDRIIGTGDIIVIDEKIAVRIQEAMDNDNVVRYFFEEGL
jgi:flagellar motor switch protein FliN/FliY